MRLSVYSSERHYIDHIAPIWLALPPKYRKTFYTDSEQTQEYAPSKGIRSTIGEPDESELVLVASYGNFRKTLGEVVYMEHGIGHVHRGKDGVIHPSYAGGPGKERVVLFLNQHYYTQEVNEQAYPDAVNEVIGTPKMDRYKAKPFTTNVVKENPVVCISFHWDAKISSESRSAFSHYRKALPLLARAKDFTLIAHAHPRAGWQEKFRPLWSRYGIEFVDNFDEVLQRADVYVCDNSSTIYEFAYTSKQVVVLNAPWYRRDVQQGIRFWDHIPGVQINSPRELLPELREAIKNPKTYETDRVLTVQELYPYYGEATQRAVQVITAYLDGRSN